MKRTKQDILEKREISRRVTRYTECRVAKSTRKRVTRSTAQFLPFLRIEKEEQTEAKHFVNNEYLPSGADIPTKVEEVEETKASSCNSEGRN
jgi:hypothetical protein